MGENMKPQRWTLNFAMTAIVCSASLTAFPTMLSAQASVSNTQSAQSVVLPEGTELKLQFNERLSSATNRQGDTFTISLASPITLPDGTVIPAGFRGRGEVTAAEKRGFMGRAGDLSVRLEYLRIGATRINIRANKASEGQGALGSTVVLTVLFGPLGLLKRGKDVEIPSGQAITAFVDAPTTIPFPIAAAPAQD
jgi:hypothetical protein